jgi:outer membrane receptor protein involved in Fe transport
VDVARKGLAIRTQIVGASLAAALITAIPSPAISKQIDVPAGTVGQAAFAIGRQGGVNVAVPDSSILNKRAPAIRGQKDAGGALTQLAKLSGLQVRKVGSNSYILVAARPQAAPRQIARPNSPIARPSLRHEPEPQLADIVVTASKRDTLSRRFAGAWSRIPGEEFAALGVRGADAIESRTVGFSSTHLGSGRNKLFIRGIADSSFSGPTQSPVGQYFGDVRTGYSGADPDLKLVDIKSVEILEGPQSTLYGSGALGGIVLLRPNMPIFNEQSGMISNGASLTRRGDAGHDTSAVFNLPLGDAVAVRAVGYRAREGGYIDNSVTGGKNINDVRVTGARATVSAKLGGDWMIDLGGAAQRIKGEDSQYADRHGPALSRESLVDQPFSSDFSLASLVIRKEEGDIRFRSTTAFSLQDVEENFDASVGADARQLRQRSEAQALSNETRLWRPMADGYSWLAGFSMITHRYAVSRDLLDDTELTDLAGAENRVHETTVFGEAGFELGPRVEATVGARYTIADLSGSGQHLSPVAVFPADAKRTERSFMPSAALLVRPLDGLTVYGRYQEGFRPGGISIAGDTVTLYRNDHLRTAELGFRYGQPGRDPFDFQASATISGWRNIQADFLDGSGLPITDNIGDGRVWTLTANGGAQLTDDLRLEAGIAWNDGRITHPAEAYQAAWDMLEGTMSIPNIARIVARGAIDWRLALGGDWALHTNLYARYVGSSRLGVGPQLGEEQGQYLDSGLLVRLSEGARAWTLNVSNLTDEVGNRFAFGAPIGGVDQITPLRPRTIRLGFEQGF